ncbi:hypothetical protein F4703DRAFT_1170101 [Phycomyces blakesleeanus]
MYVGTCAYVIWSSYHTTLWVCTWSVKDNKVLGLIQISLFYYYFLFFSLTFLFYLTFSSSVLILKYTHTHIYNTFICV